MQDATTTANPLSSSPPPSSLSPSPSDTTHSTTHTTSSTTTLATPSNDDIEAVILAATSASASSSYTLPLRDTRTQLFVANLPYRVRWQDLKDLFRRAGTVLRADVSLGPDNRSRGYGTVLLATAEDAGRAVDMFSGYSWQGRVLEVRADRIRDFDQPFPEDEILGAGSGAAVGRNLFVGNLPFHVQWQDLKDLFRQAGTIVRADVALGPDGRSRGFGTVVFATEKDARRAVGMFSGYEYNGRTLKVHYDKFSPAGFDPLSAASPLSASSSGLNAAANYDMMMGLSPSAGGLSASGNAGLGAGVSGGGGAYDMALLTSLGLAPGSTSTSGGMGMSALSAGAGMGISPAASQSSFADSHLGLGLSQHQQNTTNSLFDLGTDYDYDYDYASHAHGLAAQQHQSLRHRVSAQQLHQQLLQQQAQQLQQAQQQQARAAAGGGGFADLILRDASPALGSTSTSSSLLGLRRSSSTSQSQSASPRPGSASASLMQQLQMQAQALSLSSSSTSAAGAALGAASTTTAPALTTSTSGSAPTSASRSSATSPVTAASPVLGGAASSSSLGGGLMGKQSREREQRPEPTSLPTPPSSAGRLSPPVSYASVASAGARATSPVRASASSGSAGQSEGGVGARERTTSPKRSPTSPHAGHASASGHAHGQGGHHHRGPGMIALPPPPMASAAGANPVVHPYANGTAAAASASGLSAPPPGAPAGTAPSNGHANNNGAGVHPAFAPPAYALTPLGLPPITPSMPPFSFLPMPMPSPQALPGVGVSAGGYFGMPGGMVPMGAGMMTPTGAHYLNMTPLATPTSPHFPAYVLAPPPAHNSHSNGAPVVNGMGGGAMVGMGGAMGMGMGPPSALSPGAFWGRAGEGNMYGAPVGQPPPPPGHTHMPHASPYMGPYAAGGGGSPGFFGMHSMHSGQPQEPKGYFDFPPAGAWGGAAPASSAAGAGATAVEKEILREQPLASPEGKDAENARTKEEREGVEDDAKTDAGEAAAEQAQERLHEQEQEEQAQQGQHQGKQRRHSSDPPPTPGQSLTSGLSLGVRRGPPAPLRLPSNTGSSGSAG